MEDAELLEKEIFETTNFHFEKTAIKVFNFQYNHNSFYKNYCHIIKVKPEMVTNIEKIPFLPIQFFKNNEIKTTDFKPQQIFTSSGTTGTKTSSHFVKKTALYQKSFTNIFHHFYGNVKDYCVLGLLPSYLERQGSSLVYMVDDLITKSKHPLSGFYLHDYDGLKQVILQNESNKQPTFLIGVTYALLDFAEQNPMKLKYTTIMETGGMKGRREELTRTEVHKILSAQLGLKHIHSEYGMTELLSQAYSQKDEIFYCPQWMKILIREQDDPFKLTSYKNMQASFKTGAVNIIDLANLYSCAFIATDDFGKLYVNDGFNIIGRLQNSDIRGCGLMIL